jgi:type VI secretion system secreted protein Hcp
MEKIQFQKMKIIGLGLILVLSTVGFLSFNTASQADSIKLNQFTTHLIMEVDGVDGESKFEGANHGIDILSFSWSLAQPNAGATGATRRRGNVIINEFFVIKEMDKSSPKLAEAVAQGKVYPKVTITSYLSDNSHYYQYELKNVIVSSYQVSGSAGGESLPVESISLNFEEIKYTYTEFDDKGGSKGNVEFSWKVEEGES